MTPEESPQKRSAYDVLPKWEGMGDGWMEHGRCRGSANAQGNFNMFFPGNKGSIKPGQELCHNGCPVILDCLQYALDAEIQWGIWGGTTPPQRERMLNEIRSAADYRADYE